MVAIPFGDGICELSLGDGVDVIDCPPELTVIELVAGSPADGVVAFTVKTETGVLSPDEPNSSISILLAGARGSVAEGEIYECFVRGSGEAECRAFSGFAEIEVPAGGSPPLWDPNTKTFTLSGFAWDPGFGVLTWNGVPVDSAIVFLRSPVDVNRTNTIAFSPDLIGPLLIPSGETDVLPDDPSGALDDQASAVVLALESLTQANPEDATCVLQTLSEADLIAVADVDSIADWPSRLVVEVARALEGCDPLINFYIADVGRFVAEGLPERCVQTIADEIVPGYYTWEVVIIETQAEPARRRGVRGG